MIGDIIRRHRDAAGLSQTALAQAVGVSQPYISEVESGKRTNLELDTLRRIAEVLNLSVQLVPAEEPVQLAS